MPRIYLKKFPISLCRRDEAYDRWERAHALNQIRAFKPFQDDYNYHLYTDFFPSSEIVQGGVFDLPHLSVHIFQMLYSAPGCGRMDVAILQMKLPPREYVVLSGEYSKGWFDSGVGAYALPLKTEDPAEEVEPMLKAWRDFMGEVTKPHKDKWDPEDKAAQKRFRFAVKDALREQMKPVDKEELPKIIEKYIRPIAREETPTL